MEEETNSSAGGVASTVSARNFKCYKQMFYKIDSLISSNNIYGGLRCPQNALKIYLAKTDGRIPEPC